ncbi:serine/threonine protein kinase [Zymoseptoria brevis]|uniref:Serine/threonine protein kinase n=1 Tax=Zymoseptoria brevis TaxID=1047168 RepID=A0A0F4G8J8_9PEZI|nr:serine/threonine protein kinase [Zymoseptoria brevis]
MPLTLKIGQTLKGRTGCYGITKQLQDSVWQATDSQRQQVIVKYADHWRIRNERDVLLRFQARTPHIRPLLDHVEDESGNLILILKFLAEDALHTLGDRQFTRAEVKYIGRSVLEALKTLHADGFVHTDVKPSNILLNFDPHSKQVTDVQLADFESTVPRDSQHAKDGDAIGTAIFRSPEAHLQMPWGTPTDLISLLYGGGFHIFSPGVPVEDDAYDLKILMRHHQCFGPFPISYEEIADEGRLGVLMWIMENTPKESLKPFARTTIREISEEDKKFVLKIMKLDPRDRPTVGQLLEDEWFKHV